MNGFVARIVSVNVGAVREVSWQGRRVRTGIWKCPVEGPVEVRGVNLIGDDQADRTVHGGPAKAIYAYPWAHYAAWSDDLPVDVLPPGSFGENLTVDGPAETDVCIGDEFEVGTTRLVVTQPRMPCFKLGIRFGDAHMVKRFLATRRSGWYFGIVREGRIAAGDRMTRVAEHPARVSVREIVDSYVDKAPPREQLERLAALESLPESWRAYYSERLQARLADP